MFYGIEIAKPKEGEDLLRRPTAEELCTAYAVYRGYMNHKGTPDVQRGARYILKDYVNGKLLYCYPPPGLEAESFQDHKYEMSKEAKYLLKMNKLNKQQVGY
jgi:large subunit GTPase 1